MITSVADYIRLTESDEATDRRKVLTCSLDDEVWIEIINSYPENRKWVAFNKTISNVIIEILADDPDPDVRFAIAMKRRLDLRLFRKFADDPDESVRERIVFNAKTPISVLKLLANDESVIISQKAKERISESIL